jgi:23S rRNA pseudouridine1911/1915/1917 synthase
VIVGAPRVLTADRGDAGTRLDLVIRRHLAGVPAATRTRVQSWIESGQVAVNGATVRRVSTRMAPGDVVTVILPSTERDESRGPMAAEPIELDVLYEDEHLLAVNKPPGLVVHPTYRHEHGTMMNALLWHARAWRAAARPSLVHRLDKLTSGVVVVAKCAAAHRALQRAMASRHAQKDYLALVYGRVRNARGTIDLRLHRNPRDRRKVVASETKGAPSVTAFERLASTRELSLLRCRLMTGRMHQIRVHLAARGWPIVGDPVYGEPRWSTVEDRELAGALRGFPRQALHAWRLSFPHPIGGARLTIEAPLPPDMEGLLAHVPNVESALDRINVMAASSRLAKHDSLK